MDAKKLFYDIMILTANKIKDFARVSRTFIHDFRNRRNHGLLAYIAKRYLCVKGDWMLLREFMRDRFARQILLFTMSFFMGLLLLGASFVGGDSMGALIVPFSGTKLYLFQPQSAAKPAAGGSDSLEERQRAEAPSVETAEAPEASSRSPYVAAMPGGFAYSESIPLSYDLQRYTYAKCVEHGLEYETVLALMWRESRFHTDAVNINKNGTQDSGLMQINDMNREFLLENYGIDNLMDPIQNIDAGTVLLGMYQNKYGEHDALMAYQYGVTGMEEKQEEGVVTNDLIEMLYEQRDHYRAILRG